MTKPEKIELRIGTDYMILYQEVMEFPSEDADGKQLTTRVEWVRDFRAYGQKYQLGLKYLFPCPYNVNIEGGMLVTGTKDVLQSLLVDDIVGEFWNRHPVWERPQQPPKSNFFKVLHAIWRKS